MRGEVTDGGRGDKKGSVVRKSKSSDEKSEE